MRPRVEVSRKIADNYGEMLPGALPSPARVAEWPENNFRSMKSAGFLRVYGGEDPPTHYAPHEKAAKHESPKTTETPRPARRSTKKTTRRKATSRRTK